MVKTSNERMQKNYGLLSTLWSWDRWSAHALPLLRCLTRTWAGRWEKPCRKCNEKIPVNANYCPYCGHDQAIFEYRETPREAEEKEVETTPEPKLEKDAQSLAELVDQIRAENEKYLAKRQAEAKEAQEKRTFGKNENPEPNLIASTKLMLRDTFRTDKRMGRADFWWGYLGITMLTVLLTFPLALIVQIWQSVAPDSAMMAMEIMVYFLMCFYILEMVTGLIRRFRDAEIPVLYVVLALTVVGEIICLFLATRPQKVTNLDYTFEARSKKRQNDQNKPGRWWQLKCGKRII